MKRMSSKSQKHMETPKTKTLAAKKRLGAKKPSPRWKVVGDKVVFTPGRYTLSDIKSALRALEGAKCKEVQ